MTDEERRDRAHLLTIRDFLQSVTESHHDEFVVSQESAVVVLGDFVRQLQSGAEVQVSPEELGAALYVVLNPAHIDRGDVLGAIAHGWWTVEHFQRISGS